MMKFGLDQRVIWNEEEYIVQGYDFGKKVYFLTDDAFEIFVESREEDMESLFGEE